MHDAPLYQLYRLTALQIRTSNHAVKHLDYIIIYFIMLRS